jgi:biotin carboxyl carrier protein
MAATFEIELNGQPHAVSVERQGDGPRFLVKVQGVEHVLDAVEYAPGCWSIVRLDTGASIQAVLQPSAGGETLVGLGSVVVPLVVNGRRSRRHVDHGGPAGEQRIVAPMPGKVLRVLVAPGDEVAARQPLVVVEAMKMENELSARRAGHVREICVPAGTSVEAGRLLVVVA